MIVLLLEFGQENLHCGAGLMSEAQATSETRMNAGIMLASHGKPMLEHECDTKTRGSATVVSLLEPFLLLVPVIEVINFR